MTHVVVFVALLAASAVAFDASATRDRLAELRREEHKLEELLRVNEATGAAQGPQHTADGVEGFDFWYYRNNNSDGVRDLAPGVSLREWSPKAKGMASLAFGMPYLGRIAVGGTLPTYWLKDNAYYVVVEGNATMSAGACYLKYSASGTESKEGVTGIVLNKARSSCSYLPNTDVQNSAGGAVVSAVSQDDCCAACKADSKCFAAVFSPPPAYQQGDVFWVQAGQSHGLSGNATVFVVIESGASFSPQRTAAPNGTNPSYDPTTTKSASYRQVDNTWSRNPSPHTDECLRNGGVWNMQWQASGDAPPVLRVKWAANCSIPYHYHPTGALYFVQYGTMRFKGDYLKFDPSIVEGEARWVRPGWDYGPEYNTDAPLQITVLGTDSPPTFGAPPKGAYRVQQTREMTHVWKKQQ